MQAMIGINFLSKRMYLEDHAILPSSNPNSVFAGPVGRIRS
jgi:hypothetical protein